MLRRTLSALACLLFLAGSLQASSHQILGPDSQVIAARTGWSSELPAFEGQPETPVLLLEITQLDGNEALLLVPGTENDDPETGPFLLYESETERLYILWESTRRNIHSRLNLISWDGASWSEAVELSGHPFSFKLDPRIVVTRDRAARTVLDGESELVDRTVAHVVWRESEPQETALYSPVIFVDGNYIGWNPVLYLSELTPAEGDQQATEAPPIVSPAIRAGSSPSAVVVSFAEMTGSPVMSVGIDVMPDLLMSIGAEARSHILDVGAMYIPGNPAGLAALARSHILDVGVAFSAPAKRFLAAETESILLEAGDSEFGEDLDFLGAQARSHILDVGISVYGSGAVGLQPDQRIEIALGDEELFDLALNVRKIAEATAPQVGSSDSWLLVSADGLSLVAAWQDDADHLSFIANGDDGSWSEPDTLTLGGRLDLDRALTLLQNRLDESR